MSVCEIKTFQTYDNKMPVQGGLSDPRLGSTTVHDNDNPGMFGALEVCGVIYSL